MTSTTNTAIKSSTNTKKKTNYYAKWYYLKNRDKLNQRAKEYYHNVKKLKHDDDVITVGEYLKDKKTKGRVRINQFNWALIGFSKLNYKYVFI